MSKYIGEFTSIRGKDYKITITTSSGSNNKTVILGETPFTTQMDENDSIYEPIKCSGATVTILTDSLPTDIYSGSTLGTKVAVTSGTELVWTGYLTPCAYSQGFDRKLEELELECVDGLSVLKDIPYSAYSGEKAIIPFLQIIFNCLRKSVCFNRLYVCDTIQFNSFGTESIMKKIRVSENNFFDEKDYDAQPDADVAWNCYDVLSEIMRYMGYTMTCEADNVYIIDYDAIRAGRTRYFRYDLSQSIESGTAVTLSHTYEITGKSYAETGSNIQLTPVYNQLTVKDEFYEIESLLEGLDNAKNLINITASYDATLKQWFQSNNRFLESEVFTVKNGLKEDESFFVTLTKNDHGDIFFVIGKFYKNEMLTTYHYDHNSNALITESRFNPMMYSKLWDGKGAIDVAYFVAPVEGNKYNTWRVNYPDNFDSLSSENKLKAFASLTSIANIPSKKLTNYILCLNQDSNHIEHDKVKNYPFFKITKKLPAVFGGDNAYLVIKGSMLRHFEYNAPFPQGGKAYVHKDTKKTSIYAGEGYFWARLKWGKYYWQAEGDYKTQGSWTTTPAYFKIFYDDPAQERRCENWYDKFVNFYNTCSSLWGVDDNGYYIPAPDDENLAGTVELTVYAPKDTKGKWARNNKRDKKNSYKGYPPKVVIFKDLDIKVGYADDALNEDAMNEDTYYCNEAEGANINVADELEFKICTYDEKTPSYSVVDYLDSSGKSQYVDTLYNLATGMSLRMEEHFIIRFVAQYRQPRVKFTANLKTSIGFRPFSLLTYNMLPGKYFVIDSISTDYRYGKSEITIVEKNNSYT